MQQLYHRLKRQLMANVWLKRILISISTLIVCVLLTVYVIIPVFKKASQVLSLIRQELPNVAGRTNFLLLGTGGKDHESGDLTDTMIFVSIDPAKSDIALLSLPRDLWINSLRAKINTAYHYGEEKQPNGGGFALAKSAVSEILNQPIHFVILADFSGFEKVIDLLGGVDVEVQHAFEDRLFPVPGKEADPCEACRYETIRFEAGIVHMTGQTALKYVRSRNAEGKEGTDFARSARQQQLIKAVKTKILKDKLYLNQQLVRQGLDMLPGLVKTDIKTDQYWALIQLAWRLRKTEIRTGDLEPLLYNPSLSRAQDMQWVLLPKNDNPKAIYEFVTQLLNQK